MRTQGVASDRWTHHAESRGRQKEIEREREKEKDADAIACWIIEQCTLAYLLRIFRHLCPAQSCSRIIVAQSRLLPLSLGLAKRFPCDCAWCVCTYPDINYFRDFAREKDLRVLSLDLYNGILPSLSLLPFPLQSLFSLIFLIVCARLTCI